MTGVRPVEAHGDGDRIPVVRAWDAHGRPISLDVQEPVWLKVSCQPGLEQPALAACLKDYANRMGISLELEGADSEEFERACQELESKSRRSGGMMGKLWQQRRGG